VSPVDLARLVADAADAFRPRADERRVRLDIVPVDGLPLARVDATRIRQVVSNLVENALLHTPEGGTVTVSVGSGSAGVARVTVHDTGAGIPAEELAHVFDRFYRVDRSRDRATGGAGLGLTIVRRLVEVHGGRVAVASRPGQGTTFTVELPFAGPASDA
jgi:signal transduction histidine kinase